MQEEHSLRGAQAPPPYTPYTDSSTSEPSPILTPTSSTASLPTLRSSSPIPAPPETLQQSTDTKIHVISALPSQQHHYSEKAEPSLPRDVQRVRSPLSIAQRNSSISGNFLLLDRGNAGSGEGTDFSLQTTNSGIKSTLYVANQTRSGPVRIEARTTNSGVALTVHTLDAGQVLHVGTQTTNSSNKLFLPRSFTGLLMLRTRNSKKTLSEELQRVAVRVSAPSYHVLARGDDGVIAESIRDAMNGDEGTDWYEINGASGPSFASAVTTNSSVMAGFVGEENGGGSGSGGSCVVM